MSNETSRLASKEHKIEMGKKPGSTLTKNVLFASFIILRMVNPSRICFFEILDILEFLPKAVQG